MTSHSSQDINKRIAAEISWSRTSDRTARTRASREKFLQRFEREVEPDERRRRAEHAKRAYMLRLAKRAVTARKAS